MEPTFRTSRRRYLRIALELIAGRIAYFWSEVGVEPGPILGCDVPFPRQRFFALSYAQAMSNSPANPATL
jgi:hypothetical protein